MCFYEVVLIYNKTFPVEWLCFVDEKEIVEKLSDEQIEAEKKKNKII